MNVSGLGELSWKTDVFGVLGEFRSEFRSASAPLAQLVEQRTFNPQVLGSSPRGRTCIWLFPVAISTCWCTWGERWCHTNFS